MSDDVVGKLAKGSLFSRLFGQGRQPLRLVAVPRDHVLGDRARGDALLSGKLLLGSETAQLSDIDFGEIGTEGPLAREVQSFAWLRDLAASASREKGARLAEAIAGRWLIAHGTRVDEAWAPDLWGERIRPDSLRDSRDMPPCSVSAAASAPLQAVMRGRPGPALSALESRCRAPRASVLSKADR